MDEESFKTKTTRKSKTSKTTNKQNKNERIERLKVTIEKKKQCNAKALEVVTKLSEETVDEACLLENVRLISQEHYEDVVEERVVNALCGYALCPRALDRAAVPSQRFLISTAHNKVFDITQRKKFCSNVCYKASKFLEAQVPTSPVWLRDSSECLVVTLLPLHSTRGIAGDEVDLGVNDSLKAEVELITSSDKCSKFKNLEEKSPNKSDSVNEEYEKPLRNQGEKISHDSDGDRASCSRTASFIDSCELRNIPSETNPLNAEDETNSPLSLNVLNPTSDTETCTSRLPSTAMICDGDKKNDEHDMTVDIANSCIVNSSECSQQLNSVNVKSIQSQTVQLDCAGKNDTVTSSHQPRKKPSKLRRKDENGEQTHASVMKNVVLKVENIMKEWFTFETLCFIFGEEKIKEMLSEKHPSLSLPSPGPSSSIHDSQFYERYLSICRKLNILEMEDSRQDASFREERKKPLPDYEALRAEAEQLDLKVRMFYRGDKVQFSEVGEGSAGGSGDGGGEESWEPQVPLVDLHAQNALRRRILLDRLKRVLLDVQNSVGLKGFHLLKAVRAMVSTFTLSAHNVTMRPLEWNLVAIVIIKLLSLRDAAMAEALDRSSSKKQLTLLLLSYSLDSLYLDRLLTWLTEIDCLITKSK